ncbi:MAG: hypothetical protein U0223_19450 [Nitrospira sp.]|nr:hypothetical protein [Nitrospira sp.]
MTRLWVASILLLALGVPLSVLAQEGSSTMPMGGSREFNAIGQETVRWHSPVAGNTQGAVAAASTPLFIIRPSIITASDPTKTPRHAKTYTNQSTIFGCHDLLTLQPLPNRRITVEPVRVPNTGGHPESNHTSGRSKTKDGEYDRTDGNTGGDGLQFRPTYTSGEVAGEIELKLTCYKPDGITVSSTGSVFAHVKVDGLIPLPDIYPTYVFEGNTASNVHQDSHWVRTETYPKVLQLANAFFAEQNINNRDPKIYIRINDASLVWGGVFEAKTGNWSPPHSSHRVGEEFDVDNTIEQKGSGTVLDGPDWTQKDREALLTIARSSAIGLVKINEGTIPEESHYHFRDPYSTYRP